MEVFVLGLTDRQSDKFALFALNRMQQSWLNRQRNCCEWNMWLRALASDMPLSKGLLNHCQVVVTVAGAEAIGAEHTVEVHMQVKYSYQLCYP